MKPLHRILTLFFFLLTLSSAFAQQIPAKRYAPDFSAPDPYGLVNLDASIASPDYVYANQGVPMSGGAIVFPPFQSFSFTKLTSGSYSSTNTDIFMMPDRFGSTVLLASQLTGAQWSGSAGSGGGVSFNPGDYQPSDAILLRKYRFPQNLADVNGVGLSQNTRKAIILIHGWNPASDNDSYDEPDDDKQFYALKENIKAAIQNSPNSGWQLFVYRWEKDADTGPMPPAFDAPINGSEAAEAGHRHGQHLGQLLDTESGQKLGKVHFIAHSAGSWVARGATKYLLSARKNTPDAPPIKIQVSLLDPFIPDELSALTAGRVSHLTRQRMNDMGQFYGADSETLYRLDNFYSEDPAFGTNRPFSWRSGQNDMNGLRVGVQFSTYGGHPGPVLYYADTVAMTLTSFGAGSPASEAPARINNAALVNPDAPSAWKKSLFYNEPFFFTEPSAAPVAVGASVELASFAKIRGGTNYGRPIYYEWQTSTNNFANFTVVPTSEPLSANNRLLLQNMTAAHHGHQYRCRAYTEAGEVFSRTVVISVIGGSAPIIPPSTAPAAPSALLATAVSASQINLRWNDNSSNETGFRIQRRTASGTFADITTPASANSTTFSNTAGLSAATTYFYRIRAFNSTGDSAYSGEASATTLAGASATYTLTVEAVNLDTGAAMSVPVYTWLGASTDIREQTTTFTRAFTTGAEVKIAAFPTASGKQFKYMQSGGDVRSADTWTIPMTGNKTVVIAYGSAATVGKTLTSIAIEGDSSVDENDSETYKARATFSDGTSALVSASDWDITSGSSYADISSSGRLDAEAVSSDRSITIEATYTAGGITKTATKSITIRNSVSAQTYTLTRNVVGSGEIGYSPKATSYAAGTVVSLHGNEGDGYVFDHWSGDASGTDDDTTVRMDRDRTVTAHFVVDTSVGNIRVDISPPQAVAEGAQWRYDNFTAWRPSGDLQDFIATRTNRNVRFKDIPGWITPENAKASIVGGQTTVVSGAAATYREILGAVQVTIQPSQAATAGARWRLDGGAWQESSVTLQNASTGSHTIEFLAIPGWTTPPSQNIAVARGITTTRTGDYGPPAGFPIITSVSPKTGPIEGGTVVTIEGVNLLPGATVTFGGVPATSVTVVSGSKITAITPARASYGTVALALTSGGQTVTQANGFSYLNPYGSNIELVSQIGGRVETVAVVGNLCYYGEGTSLVIADFTNSAAPVERGRITLPAIVKDVVVQNNIAFVADWGAGLYTVDVTTPTAPAIVGFFDTDGAATGVAVLGGLAYVADSSAGLQILNVTNPAVIVRVGVSDTAGRAEKVSVGVIASKTYAFVAEGDLAMRVIDVSTPSAPTEIASVLAQSAAGIKDVKLVGTNLYVSDWQIGVKIFNASDPANLVQTGSRGNVGPSFIDVVANRLYTCGSGLRVADLSVTPVPTNLGYFDPASSCYDLAVANNLAFAAMGRDGLKVVNVSNPASMSLRTSIQTLGDAEDVWVSGSIVFVGNAAGLHSLDVTNPARPFRIGSWTGGEVTDLVVANNKATVVRYGEEVVRVLDVSNPTTPSLLGSYTSIEAWGIGLIGSSPLVVGRTKDTTQVPLLDVLNLSNPSIPQSTGSVVLDSANGIADAVTVVGNWAFVARPNMALDVISLANPASPQKLGSVPIPNFIRDVAASEDGNFVYVGDGALGIQVVNVTVKSAPVLAQVLDPPQTANSGVDAVQVLGNRLFAEESGFIFVYDIAVPASPQLLAYYDVPGSGYGIFPVGDLIYVADGSGGLSILRLKDVDKPTVAITTPTTNTAYPTTNAQLTLGGTATDLQGVVRVTWENDRGGGGVAQGTTAWTIPNLQLAAGINVLTVTAEDAQGNLARDSITVTATLPETDGPALLVTGPKPPPAFTFPSDTLPLTGTAADASGVQSIAWANDRGGSGPATGTTAWIADIPLLEGPNRITLTARDTAGNESQTEVLVTYLPPDAIAPTVGITFPTDAQEATTADPLANLSGEADDDRAVSRVTWASSRGGSGEATGARAWHINGIVLQPGVNILTITVEDAAGNTGTDTLAVTFAPTGSDPARPVLAVQTPAAKPLVTEQNHIACTGQASGGSAIAEVIVQTNDGPWSSVTGTANWAADLPLAPGRNVLRFKAIDATGRESLPVERVVTYRKLAPLALATTGQGTPALSGKPDLAAMEVGKLYTADAKPAKGWIFAGWEGAVVSNSKRVSFVMEEGATLNAVFVENPYDELAAVYHGLLRADPLAHATSGAATIALTKSGAFTAKFIIGGEKLRLKGAFDGTGTFLGSLKANPTLDVLLALDTATAAAPVTGLLSDGATTMALNAWPTVRFLRNTPPVQAGEYTLAIEPGIAPAPSGHGVGTGKVSANGNVKFKGRLANGAKFTAGSAITVGNRVPIYVSLDKGRSSFSAPLVFADKPDSDLDGIAFWSSAREQSAKYPFAPFAVEPRLFAQQYTPPARGERALHSLNATNGAATLTLGTHTQTFTLGTDNRLTYGNPLLDGFNMTLKPKTGEFSGSLMVAGERAKFGGVLLEKSGDGVGVSISPNAEMTLELSPGL